ncbi:MAG: DNA recombination/repair protein RecA [Verrucomicrobia subdivision 3 bacterium]|nr:DNA recombination/repair protein RecA [Limisphaerales bacterium]
MGTAALLRERLQTTLGSRFEATFLTRKTARETLPSLAGEIPRGALTEIAGPASSGRTSLLYSLLAAASAEQEFCALLDAEDTFDPESAAAAGVRLSQVLWVRCGGNVEHTIKASDLLAQAGGFGLVAIDLGDTPVNISRRIPLVTWFRLRHAVENTRTVLAVLTQQVLTHPCSALKIELSRNRVLWRGLLDSFEVTAKRSWNHQTQERRFTVSV